MCFCLFPDYLSLKKGVALLLNKIKYFLHKDTLSLVWLKLVQWFWRRLLKFFNVFSLFCYYLLLENGLVLPLNKLEFTLTKDSKMLCAKFGWIQSCAFGEDYENVNKNKTTTTTTTNNRRILIRKAHFNFWLMWAKDKIIVLYYYHISISKLPSSSNTTFCILGFILYLYQNISYF